MPGFRYQALDRNGRTVHGVIDAASRAGVIEQLQNAGQLPIHADEIGGNHIRLSALRLRRQRMARDDVLLLTGELATLLQAGLPLDQALKTLAGLTDSAPLRDLIHQLTVRVQSGAALSAALAEHAGVFDSLYINMIRAGEAGGSLESAIARLAAYLERMKELRSSVVNALIYPAILLIVSVLSLFFLMSFVVPRFVPLFAEAGQPLPLFTSLVFSLSGLLNRFWWLLMLFAAAAVWLAKNRLSEPERRLAFDAWCLRLPVLGELICEIEMARFARTLGTAMHNGVPLLSGLRLVREVLGNRLLAVTTDRVIAGLEQGRGMAAPMQAAGVYPALAVQLIGIGEESGRLEIMLDRIADIYDSDIKTRLKRLLTLLEPVLILGLGGLVALIILSILAAMLGLNELVI